MCLNHSGIQTTSQNFEPWKEDSSRCRPLPMPGNERYPIVFFWLKSLQTCLESFSNVDKLTVHGVREHGHEKPFQCSFCGQGFVRQQILDKHVKMHTGERPFRWFVNSLIAVYMIKLWQVWPVWWGFHPGRRSEETRPETQDQRGHPYRGGEATAWTGKKAVRVLRPEICRSQCLKKAFEIPYGYQGLCLHWVW